ncbi:pyridoxamine 5'-phosphate oxidase family protein [Streptomyces sp. NPDC052396]|uniref:pyridoxamine 5'-phosphate oxidase family protein n=1 Tax=Streptomyces sp. NPDC052396 TaxID=3365689 RepID=UPI0037D3596A
MSPDADRALELLGRQPYGRLSLSMHALPFVVPTRHIVVDGTVMARLPGGFGYAGAGDGSVIAYEADNFGGREEGEENVWSVQCIGTARVFTPGPAQLELFGPAPRAADNAPFIPEYLCIAPQFIRFHHLEGVPARQAAHAS